EHAKHIQVFKLDALEDLQRDAPLALASQGAGGRDDHRHYADALLLHPLGSGDRLLGIAGLGAHDDDGVFVQLRMASQNNLGRVLDIAGDLGVLLGNLAEVHHHSDSTTHSHKKDVAEAFPGDLVSNLFALSDGIDLSVQVFAIIGLVKLDHSDFSFLLNDVLVDTTDN